MLELDRVFDFLGNLRGSTDLPMTLRTGDLAQPHSGRVRRHIADLERRERERRHGEEHRPSAPDWLLEQGVNRDALSGAGMAEASWPQAVPLVQAAVPLSPSGCRRGMPWLGTARPPGGPPPCVPRAEASSVVTARVAWAARSRPGQRARDTFAGHLPGHAPSRPLPLSSCPNARAVLLQFPGAGPAAGCTAGPSRPPR